MLPIHRPILAALLAITALILSSCESARPPDLPPPDEAEFKTRVTIWNHSRKAILLGLRGPESHYLSLPARSSRELNLPPGSYKYAATAGDEEIISGYKHLPTKREESWSFEID